MRANPDRNEWRSTETPRRWRACARKFQRPRAPLSSRDPWRGKISANPAAHRGASSTCGARLHSQTTHQCLDPRATGALAAVWPQWPAAATWCGSTRSFCLSESKTTWAPTPVPEESLAPRSTKSAPNTPDKNWKNYCNIRRRPRSAQHRGPSSCAANPANLQIISGKNSLSPWR